MGGTAALQFLGTRRRRGAIGPLVAAASAVSLLVADGGLAQTPDQGTTNDLQSGFEQPPQEARPRVWWHWMGGNITAEGAALDLEWMQRVGIGGVHIFSGSILDPKVIDPPVRFMSPQWQRIFADAVQTARGAGMEVTIAGSPGWSQTGGPWVEPADAMKKYVWSETLVQGGRPLAKPLPLPPAAIGPFMGVGHSAGEAGLYGDSVVLAFRTPEAEAGATQPTLTSSAGDLDLAPVHRADLSQQVKLPIAAGSDSAWIEATFGEPTTVAAVSLGLDTPASVEVQASADGITYRSLMTAAASAIRTIDVPSPQQTYAFAPTAARHFRVILTPPPPAEPLPGMPSFMRAPPPATSISIRNIAFESGARVDRFESKAGFEPTIKMTGTNNPPVSADAVVDSRETIDLTGRMQADGTLDWTPPPGEWTILRFGWSLTGHKNGPAEPGATGLEVDKLDPDAVRRYLDAYLALYSNATGGALGEAGVQNLLTDSWEAGVQNWTPGLMAEFRARRGYDPLPYLPVLAGRVVDSRDASERFLWDFRQTLQAMVADHHHGVLAEELHKRGMGFYSEANGDNPRAIADGMTLKARADIPTSEYWYRPFAAGPGQPSLKADLEEAASAAHVYGKPYAAAEALTVAAGSDPWSFSPAMLKPVADEIFARGINRFLIHESHLQPLVDARPGLMMMIFGQFFNRNETWAEEADSWVDYLARSSHLLQQGQFVADVGYFYGEERNLTELFRERVNTDVPVGYHYDYINPEALLTLLSVRDGRIITPSGMSYSVLYMPDHVTRYSLPAISKLRELVTAGAVLVGPRPTGGLGLGSPDAEVLAVAKEIWGEAAEPVGGRRVAKGRVYSGVTLAAALAAEDVAPDVALSGASEKAQLLTLHRRTQEADIYFISNQQGEAEEFDASFRVAGKAPELWRAETGGIEPLGYRIDGDRVHTSLRLEPHEALFVVLRQEVTSRSGTAPELHREQLLELQGPWPVSFEEGRGAPASASFDQLLSWPQSDNPGIRYFSGAATYSKQVSVPRTWLAPGRRVLLDLGEVRELATVSVNGTEVGTAWHAPYRVDITDALQPGENKIEIRVVNLWPNRLIGDKQPGATPITYAPQSPYKADSELLRSGLLGPVRLMAEWRE